MTCFKPTAATMSPVRMVSRSSRLLACISRSRPRRSFFDALGRVDDGVTLFEGARVDAQVRQLADVGVGHDLEGQRARRARRRRACARAARPCRAWCPGSAAGRPGEGRKSTTASSIGWTPLFLKAEPFRIGTQWSVERAAAQRAADVVGGDVLVAEDLLHQVVVEGREDVEQLARGTPRPEPCSSLGDRRRPRASRRCRRGRWSPSSWSRSMMPQVVALGADRAAG